MKKTMTMNTTSRRILNHLLDMFAGVTPRYMRECNGKLYYNVCRFDCDGKTLWFALDNFTYQPVAAWWELD